MAICEELGLTEIPDDLPDDTTHLYARGNKITRITSKVLSRLVKIKTLDLSKNNIVKISNEAFRGLKRLSDLKLENNQIKISQLDSSTFKDLKNLNSLRIRNNDDEGVVTYNGRIFTALVNLKHLFMDGISNVTFESDFSNLTSLRSLALAGHMNYIRDDTFNIFGPIDLQKISIRANITDIEINAFSQLNSLKSLSLSGNIRLGLSVSKIWPNLNSTNITQLRLDSINDGQFIILKNSFFYGLDNIVLKFLDLSQNQIVNIERGFHKYVPHLEQLILRRNHISSLLDIMCEVCFLNSLSKIDMYTQFRASINVVNIFIPEVTNSVSMNSRGGRCSLACQETPRDYEAIHFVLQSNMRNIIMGTALSSGYKLLPDIIVHGRNDLKYIDFSNNAFQEFNGKMVFVDSNPSGLKLDFSLNNCFAINDDCWKDSGDSIVILNLNNNRLGELLGRQGNSSFLQWLTQLVELDLFKNNIKNLPRFTFLSQINLQRLRLGDNSLTVINFEVSHMKHLYGLDLAGNLLIQLTDIVYNTFSYNMHLSLKENPLLCSCDTMSFLEWMNERKGKINNWSQHTCTYKSKNTKLSLLEGTILPDLTIACSSKTLLIIASVTLTSICLIIGISVCLYRHRFEVKYACIRLIWQRKKYNRLIREDKLMYKYDAFVAYHKDYIWFVRGHMIKQLEETDSPLKLCVHERDFMPGCAIEENIIDAIESSRKTILVLTRSFLLSYWCDFEYHMARIRCTESGDDAIVTIILEELPGRHISKPLLTWLKRRTYLEWPENSLEVPHFWEKLKEAIEC